MTRAFPGSPRPSYNGMIAPLVPYAIRGAIWYQGEANASAGGPMYGLQLRDVIANWRHDWDQGDFPFIYVQLPNFMAPAAAARRARRLAADPRADAQDACRSQHRHGRDYRHRRGRQHPSAE